MTVREFRKLLHGVDADAVLVFNLVGVGVSEGVLPYSLSVAEQNSTPDGQTAVKSVCITLDFGREVNDG